MIYLEIGKNEEGQRLDRFLRKYLPKASLSGIYKLIRKDVKVNNRREKENYFLKEGDKISLYMTDEEVSNLRHQSRRPRAKKQFEVCYEDDNLLIVNKPFGLLTHGDGKEKKNHLANQVVDYLIEKGEYNPRTEKTFSPASANRLDRNTTGLVVFGKNSEALRELNRLLRTGDGVAKYYLAIVRGELKKKLDLGGFAVKDEGKNKVEILAEEDSPKAGSKEIRTLAEPMISKNGYTLVKVRLFTGRSHQIRAHLAETGFPILGDPKYGRGKESKVIEGNTAQMLHAWKLVFDIEEGPLAYLKGKEVEADLPKGFKEMKEKLFR